MEAFKSSCAGAAAQCCSLAVSSVLRAAARLLSVVHLLIIFTG